MSNDLVLNLNRRQGTQMCYSQQDVWQNNVQTFETYLWSDASAKIRSKQ